ncbi:hypothetical protein [Streptomyces maremycinicus]|uniref:hypothetical protein n=1 Tax=Streptomyces maremycinicus TaxID=1679753 RepID=UPI000A6D7381|nr:hypothetical protein [Streptomyces sp. NBRC 110468]
MPLDPGVASDCPDAAGAVDVLRAIDAVDWTAIPRPTSHTCDEPERVAPLGVSPAHGNP